MDDFRASLKKAGWCQGIIIPVHDLPDTDLPGPGKSPHSFLILSQTCDLLSHNLAYEPTVELLPLFKLPKQKPDKNLIDGFNPRRIQFQIQDGNTELWVESAIRDLVLLPRKKLTDLAVKPDLSISRSRLQDLCLWRAARYLRPAFPEAFEMAFREQARNFKAIVEEQHDHIARILIDYQPRGEITGDDFYEVGIVFLMKPENFKSPALLDLVRQVAADSETALRKIDHFDEVTCSVASLAEFSLWEARSYLDWSRYDYLSFGEEG